MAIADLRKDYALGSLDRADLATSPFSQFATWFDQARGAGRIRKFFVTVYKAMLLLAGKEVPDINAMVLATASKDGRTSARVVLLKGMDDRGFVFYTNYHSRKGRDLEDNPQAALVFYWSNLERQVCVRGTIQKLPEAESDQYFNSRPRGSRIGAWASNQTQRVRNRQQLEQQWDYFEKKFPGSAVPRPPHWGGYLLIPTEMEFWQGRPSRMHDRFQYCRQSDGTWALDRLSP